MSVGPTDGPAWTRIGILLAMFFPEDWRRLGDETGAFKGLRKGKSPEGLLRVLLIHLASGHSLRETAVRARRAGLADLSAGWR
ncbi:MAG: hypothetical protein F4089_03815 [Gammaproteobacteria bacterium]|nr:hypothetical protein [Gammaproteobacteria bacterium]